MLHRQLAAFLVIVCAAFVALEAALPTFWQVSTEADFLRGEVENLSIDSYGRLTLGPTSTPIYDSSAPFIWTAITLADGSVYAGSGNEGQVYRIDPSGKGSVFFDSEELEVHALAAVPGGGIYVGTSPQGKIYKVDATGKAAVFFDPGDRYIWSLAVDKNGAVFAATGDKGVIYRITPDGKGTVFYETKATHAMTLAFDRDGRLLAGTESPGRVFRIDSTGRPFVILDSSFNEIRSIRVDKDGMMYAVAVSSRVAGTPSPTPSSPAADSGPTPVVTVSAEVTAIGLAEPSGGGPPPQQTPRSTGPVTGAIYRISPDGASDLVWELREDTPYDVAFEGNGSLLVATGNKGKIYRLAGEPYQPTLVVRANVQQVTAILPEREGRMLYATANPGKVLRLSASRADRGTYTSDVRDAQTVAAWGTIRWRTQLPSGTRVDISTRSGNTRTPDETWSDWAAAYTNQAGSAITSPRARYLQGRAILTGARGESPLLTSVSAAYLPRNLRPRVTAITIHPPGTVFQRPFPTDPEIAGFDGDLPDRRNAAAAAAAGSLNLGRRVYQKGLLTFVWRAEDDNKDDLSYDVFYRREGETSWKILKRGVVDPILVWDTTSVPNGSYLLRVVASDAGSNSPSTALTGALESSAFDIDNAPPDITISSVRRDGARLILEFEVRDEYSAVQRADYSLDGDKWQTIYPKDGIADSRVEQFELVLEGEAVARGVIVRAADALNNVSSARGEAPAAPAPAAPSGRR
jgi:outer membrane protein assembly factor BamB